MPRIALNNCSPALRRKVLSAKLNGLSDEAFTIGIEFCDHKKISKDALLRACPSLHLPDGNIPLKIKAKLTIQEIENLNKLSFVYFITYGEKLKNPDNIEKLD